MRRLTVFLALVVANTLPHASVSAQFAFSSYTSDKSFADGLGSTTVGAAYDGSSYWSTSGGSQSGTRLAQYSSSGALIGTYAPGLDFRSVFTDAAGNVYAREFALPTIYRQTTPGVFVAQATLTGGTLDNQSSVVFNGAGTEYLAMLNGTVSRWDLGGTFLGSVALSGFGSVGGESNYPANRGIASLGSNYLTYDSGTLSMWDPTGTRLGTTSLVGGGSSFDSNFSFSRADDSRVWVVDNAGGTWSGYTIEGGAVVTPEPASLVLLATGMVAVAGVVRRKRGNLG